MHVQLCYKHYCGRYWDSRHKPLSRIARTSPCFLILDGHTVLTLFQVMHIFCIPSLIVFHSCSLWFSAVLQKKTYILTRSLRTDSIIWRFVLFSETTDTKTSESQCIVPWFMHKQLCFKHRCDRCWDGRFTFGRNGLENSIQFRSNPHSIGPHAISSAYSSGMIFLYIFQRIFVTFHSYATRYLFGYNRHQNVAKLA